jgi:signal transduction histidine kinase/CheY-like chemotaxis protein
VGKTDYELWPGQGDSYRKDDQDVIQSGKPKLNIEDRLPAVGNKVSYVTTNKVPLRDMQGQIVGVLGTAADITEQKRIEAELKLAKERAEKASEAKSQFIANMSHDLRTPLNGILGMAQVLEMNEADSEKKAYIHDIMSSSQRLTNLLNEILEISQIDSGKLPVRLVEFEPRILAEDMYQLFKSQSEQKQIRLLYQYDDEIPDFVLGDKHRLHRILLNLLGNAVKFTETGYVKLTAKLKIKKQNQVVLQFSVKDTGMGIPEDKFDEIFEKFSRLDPAYKGQYQGVGLGLGIVKQMVEEIGGTISVKSEIKKGSTFICVIPFELVSNKKHLIEEKAKETRNFDAALARLENLKILLVEDDKICQRVIQGILKGTGFVLDIADTVSKARKLLGEFEYDIIFMDVGLPDGDGIAFTKEIRKEMKIKTPIIATTAHVGKERKSECFSAGMDGYVAKPVEVKAIKKALVNFSKKDHILAPIRTKS